MIRALTFAALVASLPAWAVGEHITVTGPAKDQLKETLCISMECKGGGDYVISSRVVGGQMELKVSGPSGPRFSTLLPLGEDGQLSNSDAMTATSQLIQAIENPNALKKAEASEKPEKVEAAQKPVWSKAKKAKWAKIQAKKKLAKHRMLASR
jgi:hypothetical protein